MVPVQLLLARQVLQLFGGHALLAQPHVHVERHERRTDMSPSVSRSRLWRSTRTPGMLAMALAR